MRFISFVVVICLLSRVSFAEDTKKITYKTNCDAKVVENLESSNLPDGFTPKILHSNFFKPVAFKLDLEGSAKFFLSVSGEGSQQLRKEGDSWVYETQLKALGHKAIEISTFKVGNGGEIIPIQYQRLATGWAIKSKDRKKTLTYDWDKNQVHFVEENKTFRVPRYSYDRNLLQLILRFDALSGKKIVSYGAPDFNCKVENVHFTFRPEKIGGQDVIRVYYEVWHGRTKSTIWLSPKDNFNVVKYRFQDPNIIANLKTVSIDGKKIEITKKLQ